MELGELGMERLCLKALLIFCHSEADWGLEPEVKTTWRVWNLV
jgi:hypothetical protein